MLCRLHEEEKYFLYLFSLRSLLFPHSHHMLARVAIHFLCTFTFAFLVRIQQFLPFATDTRLYGGAGGGAGVTS